MSPPSVDAATSRAAVHQQFIRYAVVGLASNGAIYLVYLLLTWRGVEPKAAMTLLYVVGVVQTFVFNKNWSFGFKGQAGAAFVRYVVLYAFGYLINYAVLAVLVDQAGLPHRWVMAVLIVFMAVFLFVGQKYWIFGDRFGRREA